MSPFSPSSFACAGVAASFVTMAAPAQAQLAAAGDQTCIVDEAGKLKCWGVIGEFVGEPWGSTDLVAVPTTRKGLSNVKQAAMSRGHACAVLGDGTARCWGYNDDGQLGNGRRLSRYPVDIPKPDLTKLFSVVGLTGVTQVATGDRHTCAVAGGRVHCWGANGKGQVGAKATLKPLPVAGVPAATAVACGADHSCALTTTGAVYCWGSNASGQMGIGKPSKGPMTPTRVPLPKVTSLDARGNLSCALTNGKVHCWGAAYELSDKALDAPVDLSPAKAVDHIAVGQGLCAVLRTGEVTCRGAMATELRGGGSNDWVDVGISTADDVVVSASHGCATAKGKVRCWGTRDAIQPGLPREVDKPTAVVGLKGVTSLSLGSAKSCALTKARDVWCWGGSRYEARPRRVAGVSNVKQLSVGSDFACGVDDKRKVHCWGHNGNGQLGRGTVHKYGTPRIALAPATVTVSEPVVHVAAGDGHACVTTKSGKVRCWGNAYGGRLGTLFAKEYPDPVLKPKLVPGVSGSLGAAAGDCHAASWSATGVIAWGCNRDGRLGAGTFEEHASPKRVVGLSGKIVQVALGALGCARNARGDAWCWGDNAHTAIPFEERDIIDVAAGFRRACIVRKDGSVYCGRPGAMEKVVLPKASRIRTGRDHTCALLRSGQVRCWGRRDEGVLGDGVPDFIRTPRVVAL